MLGQYICIVLCNFITFVCLVTTTVIKIQESPPPHPLFYSLPVVTTDPVSCLYNFVIFRMLYIESHSM